MRYFVACFLLIHQYPDMVVRKLEKTSTSLSNLSGRVGGNRSWEDGYDCLTSAKVLVDEEDGPTLTYAVQNHFKAIAMREGKTRKSSVHHQSLVTMSRK